MNIEAPVNRNYAAVVVELSQFVQLDNCQNVKAALIFGNSVIVSKDTPSGAVGLFFPVECALSPEFCAANNLFKDSTLNADPTKKGFFEQHGRVKAVKFRGHKSEGFWIPVESLSYCLGDYRNLPVGTEFDKLGEHPICHKYIPRGNRVQGEARIKQGRQARAEDKIIEGQFRFHIDTDNLRRNSHKLDPDMWISISEKWHGSSGVFANLLIKRELTWIERIARLVGVKVSDRQYGIVWSSRRVVKGIDGQEKANSVHFYGSDIWGVVAKEIADRIPKGYTIYGEVVGYTPEGGMIQKGYHYGCQPGTHRLLVYRVTSTNEDGRILELSWHQLQQFCAKYGFEMVKTLWHGRAIEFINFLEPSLRDLPSGLSWQEVFLRELERHYITDAMCPHNNNEVPAEGIVLKVDRLEDAESYKLKNFRFISAESEANDKGEVDIETAESEPSAGEE